MRIDLPRVTKPSVDPIPFNWRTVGCLLFLFGIPGIPAIFILGLTAVGVMSPERMTDVINAQYYETPFVIFIHGMSGVVFFLSMPFQFATRLRFRHPKLHRINGYVAFLSACLMGASGVWMHLVFASDTVNTQLLISLIIALAICLNFSVAIYYAIKRHIESHQRWIYFATAASLAVVSPVLLELLALPIQAVNISWYQKTSHLLNEYGELLALLLNTALAQWMFRKNVDMSNCY